MESIENLRKVEIKPSNENRRIARDLTVIVPTIGRPILQRCLESISKGSVLPGLIIVVDQGSNPLAKEWIQNLQNAGLNIFHLISHKRSPASARNDGIRNVKSRFISSIDDDCVAETDWLEKMETLLQKTPTTIITGRLEPAGDGIPPTVVTSEIPCLYTKPSYRILSPLSSANMGFSLDIAQRIGEFDEGEMAAEDNDWAYRALKSGIPIYFAPEVVVYHVHWRDRSQMAATYREYAWGQGAFYGKHLRKGDYSMVLRTAITLFRGIKDFFIGVLQKDRDRKINGFARITHLLPGLVAGLRGFKSL
jgi:GT2 family glycosyltransferase